ncbi:MAG: hypothetical protein ACXW2H_04175 [Candidatus Aminicenantales bacterium]
MKPQLIQIKRVVSLTTNEQGLGRAAGDRPALEKGVKIRFGIDAQGEDPDDPVTKGCVEDRDQDLEGDPLVLPVPAKILEDDLSRPQGLDGTWGDEGRALFLPLGGDDLLGVLRIEQHDPLIPGGRLDLAKPRPELVFSLQVFRLSEIAPDESGEDGVPIKYLGVRQTFGPPIRQFAHFQLRDSRKLALDFHPIIFFVAPVVEESCGEDPDSQCEKSRERIERRESALRGLRFGHDVPFPP